LHFYHAFYGPNNQIKQHRNSVAGADIYTNFPAGQIAQLTGWYQYSLQVFRHSWTSN